MTGYPKDELLEKSARILYLTEEDFRKVGTALYGIQNTQAGLRSVETSLRRKDGRIIEVLLSAIRWTHPTNQRV